jgi:hypothetical protein
MVSHLFFWAQLFGMHAIGVENVRYRLKPSASASTKPAQFGCRGSRAVLRSIDILASGESALVSRKMAMPARRGRWGSIGDVGDPKSDVDGNRKCR